MPPPASGSKTLQTSRCQHVALKKAVSIYHTQGITSLNTRYLTHGIMYISELDMDVWATHMHQSRRFPEQHHEGERGTHAAAASPLPANQPANQSAN